MATISLTTSVQVDGTIVQSSSIPIEAIGFLDYTHEVTTAYASLSGDNDGYQPSIFAQVVLVNTGDNDLLIRFVAGADYYFTALPIGATMVCPSIGDAAVLFADISARTQTGSGEVRVIVIYS